MTTVTVPLTTLSVGTHTVGPTTVSDTATQITLSLDRTVSNGLDSKPASTVFTMSVQQSNDGGSTWTTIDNATVAGGVVDDGDGNHVTTTGIFTWLFAGTSRQVRAQVVVSVSVAVQGSLTIT